MGLLSFELVWENQVGVSQHVSVGWDYVFVDVKFSLVAHDGIKDYRSISQCLHLCTPATISYSRRTTLASSNPST